MGSPAIFAGSTVKFLKSTLDLFGNAQILTGSTDPTSSAVSAPKGSIYLNTSNGNAYKKNDAGSTTNWKNLSNPAYNVVGKSAAYTITTTDAIDMIVTTGSTAYTITLPAVASSSGRQITVKSNNSSGAITVSAASAEQIDGVATGLYVLKTQYESVTLICDGSAWWVI